MTHSRTETLIWTLIDAALLVAFLVGVCGCASTRPATTLARVNTFATDQNLAKAVTYIRDANKDAEALKTEEPPLNPDQLVHVLNIQSAFNQTLTVMDLAGKNNQQVQAKLDWYDTDWVRQEKDIKDEKDRWDTHWLAHKGQVAKWWIIGVGSTAGVAMVVLAVTHPAILSAIGGVIRLLFVKK